MNRIIHGDNLTALRSMESASAALIYVDPPFNTGTRQSRTRMRSVQDDAGDRVGFGGRRYRTERLEEGGGYGDCFADFLGFLRPRMEGSKASELLGFCVSVCEAARSFKF